MSKNKVATGVSLFLLLCMAISLVALSTTNAQSTMTTFAYIGATPNPIGVNQETLLHIGITQQLQMATHGWEDLSVTITRPDGVVETISGIRTDATGGTGRVYVPTMAGNYTLQTHFPQQTTTAEKQAGGAPVGTVMLASDSEKLTLVVKEEPNEYWPGVPIPTEYWTRPIDTQAREWSSIAGNWLWGYRQLPNNFVTGNDEAPETAHILWAKPLTTGGLVGEPLGEHSFEIGDAYEGKFLNSIILAGKLYYDKYATADPYHEYVCVDLHTGEELWSRTLLNNLTISRGQLMYWDTYDYHGVYDYLWCTGNSETRSLLGVSGTTWCAFDPFTGDFVYALYRVPSGTTVYGSKGEILIYTFNYNAGYMTLWNSTNIPALYANTEYGSMAWGQWRAMGKLVDATAPHGVIYYGQPYQPPTLPTGLNGYQWNVSIAGRLGERSLAGSVQSVLDDRVVGGTYSTTEVNLWGLSLESGREGQLLFNETWKAPAEWAAGNVTVVWAATSDEGEGGVFILSVKETRQHYGFSTDTGKYLWGPTEPRGYLDIYTMGLSASSMRSVNQIAYGKFYAGSYAGVLYCYDITSGELLWTYDAVDPLNEILWGNNWPLYPEFITDGKIYLRHAEHSPVDPRPRGAPFICLNATTGEEIWRADGLFRGTHWGGYPVIGDSIIATMDTYDQRVYAIGKGPSATTVTAPDVGVALGKSVLIRGIVTDISAGTDDFNLRKRFPNGVPAVSDENMSEWMLYVYKQFALPADAVGVEVIVSVVDPNTNCYEVGRATSDASGFYSVAFTPEVPGKYTIYATFEGSGAYYGSSAETAINVEEAPAATPAPTPTPAPMTDTYVLGIGSAILIAVIIGFVVLILIFRKR